MTVNDPNDSVQDEQLDPTKAGIDNKKEERSSEGIEPEKEAAPIAEESEDKSGEESPDAKSQDKDADAETADLKSQAKNTDADKSVSKEDSAAEIETGKKADGEESESVSQPEASDPPEDLPEVDYSSRSREELVETLELLIENRPPNEIREDVEKIKVLFYKKYKSDVDEIKAKFISDGGAEEDFTAPRDELESIIKSLLSKYRGKKSEHSRQFEIEKQENLKRKYEIIDEIKDLVNREESINKTFQEFRDLQNEWYSLGSVPQSSLKNLWETYNHNVEIFYDYIKINKELRDLDFKKNFELKVALCEKAESLLNDPNPVSTFRTLQ